MKLEKVQLHEAVPGWGGPESLRILTFQHGSLTADFAARVVHAVPSASGRSAFFIPFENISLFVLYDEKRVAALQAARTVAPTPRPAPGPAKDDTIKL